MQRIEIKVSDTLSIVAEENADLCYKEICVSLVENGEWIQDLAIVGQKYHYDKETLHVINEDNKFRVLVYGNREDEDYSDEFDIDKYDYNEKE